ncbi:MAG: HAMP domain-containing sensor histidine kinase [Firmicutes bacterium]|nr:HAMP domain-containing sensor histidine kinase [Bacillota bacterium]
MPNYTNSTQPGLSLVDRRLIRKQRLRLTVINALVLAMIWIVLSAGVYFVLVERTTGQVDERLYATADRLVILPHGVNLLTPRHSQGLASGGENDDDDDDVLTALWVRQGGAFRVRTGSDLPADVRQALYSHLTNSAQASLQTITVGTVPYRLLSRQIGPHQILQVAENIRGEQDVLDDLLGLVTLVGLAGVALTIAGGYSLGLWTLRPFIAARRREQDLLSDVSHELKTPLTVMGTNLELLLRHTDTADESRLRWLSSVYAENQRMRKMVEELLQLARLDAGLELMEKVVVDLCDLCADVALLYEPVISERGLTFLWEQPAAPVMVLGDPSGLRQILYILLDNACKYTQSGHISLMLESDAHAVRIRVKDSGTGMPGEFLAKATERFARADHARKDRSSAGLGLAIANRLVETLGGKLHIRSQSGVGTEVVITLAAES